MVSRSDFTPEEWQQITSAPQFASVLVAIASPSGAVGAVKEMMAGSKMIMEAMQAGSDNSLIQAVGAFFGELVQKREKAPGVVLSKNKDELKGQCLQALRDLAQLLTVKASAEADGYKAWIYQAAVKSAEAAKEGGFLGIGGVKVNEAETAALAEIADALGITV
ncbi:MAG: hypothetical protein GXY68_05445 [Chloroflexi bacterium]|jgi:hypothetical protein|nr:hypothetical protein [Chloroflexota bacterium]